MREFCLVKRTDGIIPQFKVINMSMCGGTREPELTAYQDMKGWEWVPLAAVPQSALREYRYYNERP